MTLLELCQAVVEEGGISGLTEFETAQNQTGEAGRVVKWVKRAWLAIQNLHDDWDFLRSSNIMGQGASFPTVAGQAIYPLGNTVGTVGVLATAFTKWDRDSVRLHTTAVGVGDEQMLPYISYDAWRNGYMLGTQRQIQTRPAVVSISPAKGICLGYPPTGIYTVTADYFMAPTQMSLDADTPTGLPAQFHMAIVWRALRRYGYYDAASEVIQDAESEYRKIMAPLEAKYLPEIGACGPLA